MTSPDVLTPRWFEIPDKALDNAEQIRFAKEFHSGNFFHFTIAAGRRSFKTERFAKRLLVKQSMTNPGKRYFAGAPVRKQAKEIFWNDLKQLSPAWYIKKLNETDLKIEYNNGTILQVVGLKEFSTIEGGFAHGFVISEFQKCEPEVYNQTIEPMINDVGGWVIKEGRPLGKNHFFDDFTKGRDLVPGYNSYFWTSEEILTPLQIERAKSSLGQVDYNREYLASFETGGNPPYYAYTAYNHAIIELNPALPVVITCDFNATEKPMSWVIGQSQGKEHYWHKCFSHTFTNTQTMCEIVREYLNGLSNEFRHLIFYGDYAGKQQKSNSAFSDWQIIEQNFRNYPKFEKRLKPCKSIRNSIAATNGRLCNANNERRQFVDPEQCQALIRDWTGCEWKDNGKELKEAEPLRGHACRAVDYFNDFEYPVYENKAAQRFTNFD